MEQPPLQPRPRIASIYMALPLILGLLLLAAGGTVVFLGWRGGSASGERVEMAFRAECAQGAATIIQTRVEVMGLGEPSFELKGDGLDVIATLPGFEGDRQSVPALLARRGQLSLVMGQETLATEADLESAALHLDESGMPYNRLDFKAEAAERIRSRTAAAPDQSVAFMMDGEEIGRRPNTVEMTDRSLRLLSGEGLTADRMRRATDQNILLTTGPHPCQVAVASVSAAPPESP